MSQGYEDWLHKNWMQCDLTKLRYNESEKKYIIFPSDYEGMDTASVKCTVVDIEYEFPKRCNPDSRVLMLLSIRVEEVYDMQCYYSHT